MSITSLLLLLRNLFQEHCVFFLFNSTRRLFFLCLPYSAVHRQDMGFCPLDVGITIATSTTLTQLSLISWLHLQHFLPLFLITGLLLNYFIDLFFLFFSSSFYNETLQLSAPLCFVIMRQLDNKLFMEGFKLCHRWFILFWFYKSVFNVCKLIRQKQISTTC